MPTRDNNNNLVPDWDSCKTVEQLSNEFESWAKTVSQVQFAQDKGIQTGTVNFNNLYSKEYANYPRKFYTVSTSKGNSPYYFGNNSGLQEQLKTQYKEYGSRKSKMRLNSFVENTNANFDTVRAAINGVYVLDKDTRNELLLIGESYKAGKITEAEKRTQIEAFNKKHGTDLSPSATYSQIKSAAVKTTGGIVNETITDISLAWKDIESLADGNYVYSEAARKDLADLSAKIEGNLISEEDKKKIIQEFNKRYGANISTAASLQTLQTALTKKNGIIHITGNDIAAKIKEEAARLTDVSHIWDESKSRSIQKFVQQGITGDVMWGVIWGKYNKDDAAREDMEQLAFLISKGQGNSEEAKALRDKINTKYNLNLDDSVTAEDIAKVIESDKKYTYKKTVKQIAESVIQDKLNEQIKRRLEEVIGGKLEDWGLEFKNSDIIGTLRDIIRGNKVAFFNQEKFLQKLQRELEDKIDKMIVERVNKLLDEQQKKINSQIDTVTRNLINAIDPYRKKIDKLYDKIDTWINNPESAKLILAGKLDEMLKSPVGSIAGALDKLEPLKKFGITFGLGDMFKKISQTFTKNMATQLYNLTKPFVEKALQIVGTVKTAIKKVIDTINKLKEKAKQLIEKWKNVIKDAIKDFTKKLVNELTKFVRISFENMSVSGIPI